MKFIILFLCAFIKQVQGQTDDISPARILAQQKTISENSDLYLTCSTFGYKRQTEVFIHLCKDNAVIKTQKQRPDQNDSTFTFNGVGLQHSGNYSCVFSIKEYPISHVTKKGGNSIKILIIDISVAEPSATVGEGDDVTFRCTVSHALQTVGQCQVIHSYLTRNGTILQVQPFSFMQMEATFTIQEAVARDSGHYSCVVLPSKCIQEHEKALHGNNTVLLEVKGSMFYRLIISFGVITLMLFMGTLALGLINKQVGIALANPCSAGPKSNAEMLEGQQEIDDLEAQEEDSFSEEDEGNYQNCPAGVDGISEEDFEDPYSTADDTSARSNPASVYAQSFNRKKPPLISITPV